jgi:hypothetical protein
VTLPIAGYIGLEALHRQDPKLLVTSPEWSIATILLAMQTARLFVEGIAGQGGRLITVALLLVMAVLLPTAGINAYMGLEASTQSWGLLLTRWGLLLVASILFVCFAGSALWAEEQRREHEGAGG